MKRQNNKKGNLKKKRKYNDVENDNYYEDEQNESENTLSQNNKQTFMEVKSANLLKGESKQNIISDEAFEFASEVAKKTHLEAKPQQNEINNNKTFLCDDWMKIFKGCQVLANCEDQEICVLDITIRLGNANNEIIHFGISFSKENDYFEYEPISIPMQLDKDDELLQEGLEIPKEDLPKLLKKMLSYKVNKNE